MYTYEEYQEAYRAAYGPAYPYEIQIKLEKFLELLEERRKAEANVVKLLKEYAELGS